MRIGILSDTHGSLPHEVFNIFNGIDYIFHAGDIGDISIIRDLEALCPVFAIYGNIDSWPIISYYPSMLIKEISSKIRVIYLKAGPLRTAKRNEVLDYLPEFINNLKQFLLSREYGMLFDC